MKRAIILILSSFAAIASTFASVDPGLPTRSTPYDPYLAPVKHVLTQLDGKEGSIDHVRQLMRIGRGFRYSYTSPYTAATPEVTAATHAGDCKAKALWLAAQLNDSSVRFVIGKARAASKVSHAWLLWTQDSSHTYILDCTNFSEPILAERADTTREYIPAYAFSKRGSYRYGAMFASNTPHRKTPVAQASR
jgi:hypothetical protein